MQLGVSTYAFGWAVGVPGHPPPHPLTVADLLAFARAHGLRLIQVGDHVPLGAADAFALAALRAEADRHPAIAIEVGARGLRESTLARYLEVARALRASLVRFVIDAADYEPAVPEVVALLRTAVPALTAAGVTLGIENHDRFPARTLRRILEEVDSDSVGICLDTANSLGAGEGIDHVLGELARFTVNLHVKDFVITRVDYAMGFQVEGRPAGEGMLDIRAVRAALAPHGRCATAVLETWVPPEATLAQTIAKERRWAEASLAYLQPLFPA